MLRFSIESIVLTIQYFFLLFPTAYEEGQVVKNSTDAWEMKWEAEDHIMMRFNHRLFQFCIGFPYT